MSNNLWVLILSFFLTWSNVFSIKNKQAALNEIQQLPVVTADKGDEYATWDKVYNFLGKLEFNQDAEEIIEAIFKKYDKAKIPNSRSKIITQVIKKGADNLSKYQKHEIIVKNRAIRELSSFIIRLNTNYSNNAVSVSDLNLAEQLGIHIAILEFNKDSCDTILSIVELFKGYENFPGDIIKAIKTFVSKIVEALKKETPQTTLEKQNYNEKVKEFLEFTSKDEIKIYIKGIALPKFIEISTAWENFKKLRLQKDALVYIKNLIIKGLRVENIISNHLKTLNSSCGPKGALTEYINNEDGKKDEDFIAILMKTKKILEDFYNEGPSGRSEFHNLWDFVNSHRPLSETPSPKKDEPKDDSSKSLKDGLLLCKSRLLQLNVKLKNLSSKLLVLKKNLIEEAKPLPDFVNTDEWWVKAIANSGKITEAHKTKILEKFEKIKNLSIGNVSKLYTTIFSLYKAKDYKERVSMLGFVKKGVQERAIKILNLEKLAELSDKIFKENSDDEKFLNWLVG